MARPTQKQVAQHAGVSQTVVSQVVNGQAEQARINPETRARVQEAIETLGYVPNVAARRLVGGSSSLIGVFTYEAVFPTGTRDFYAPFLEGIEQEASHTNLDLLLYTSGGKTKRRLTESTQGRLPLTDGTILLGHPDSQDRIELASLVRTGHPVVFIGRRKIPEVNLNYVEADYATATAALTREFQVLGHQHLCYLGGPELSESALDRQYGFLKVAPFGMVERLTRVALNSEFMKEHRIRGTTGFLVENDELMRGLLQLAHEDNVTIPDDISVALLGDAITGMQPEEHWTRFEIPRRQMGEGAVQVLQQVILDSTAVSKSFPCRIVPGSTLAPAP